MGNLNAPSSFGCEPGATWQEVGKTRTFVVMRGKSSLVLLDAKNGPVVPFIAVRCQVPLTLSGNPAVAAVLEEKAYMFTLTFPEGMTPPMKAALRAGRLPKAAVLMSGRTYISAGNFAVAVRELSAYTTATYTVEERMAVALERVAVDVSIKADQNLSRVTMMKAWDATVESVFKDAAGFIAALCARGLAEEDLLQLLVERESELCPNFWSKWQAQLSLETATALSDREREESSARMAQRIADFARRADVDRQVVQQVQQQLSPGVRQPFGQRRRSSSPVKRGDGGRWGGADRDRDGKPKRTRSPSGSRSRSRSPPPRRGREEEPAKPAGGAGRGGGPPPEKLVRVEVKRQDGYSGAKVDVSVQKRPFMCRYIAMQDGCKYSEDRCKFYHSEANLKKHKR